MKTNRYIILLTTLLTLSISVASWAVERHPMALMGHLSAVDAKKKFVVIDSQRYKLRQGAKIFVGGKRVSRSSLFPDRTVRYTTHKNQRTGKIEIKEIRVLFL